MTPPVTSDGPPPAKRPRTTSPAPPPISTSPSLDYFLPPKFLLHLQAIASGTWKEGYYYEGKLSLPTSEAEESSEALLLKLSSSKSALLVELRGDWVAASKEGWSQLQGKRVAVLCRGGSLEGKGSDVRVVAYGKGVTGWTVEDRSSFWFGELGGEDDIGTVVHTVLTKEDVAQASDLNTAEVPRQWGLVTPKNGNNPARTYLPLSRAFDPNEKTMGYFIAVASFFKEPAKANNGRGPDWFLTVYLKDPTRSDGIRITLYATSERYLRRFQNGDILILQRLSLNTGSTYYTGRTGDYNLTHFNPSDLLDKEIAVPKGKVVGAAVIGQGEVDYAERIARWWLETGSKISVTGGSKKRSLAALKDLEANNFYDVIGEVVRETFDTSSTPKRILYLSDYTTNELLFDYVPNTPHWSGPLGQQSIQIIVAEPYPDMKKGDIVIVRNLRAKFGMNGLLEGGTWTRDGEKKQQMDVELLDVMCKVYKELQPRLDIFIRRRANYWRKEDGRQAVGRNYNIFDKMEAAADKQNALASEPPPTCTLLANVVPIDDSRLSNVKARRHRGVIVDFWPRRLQEWIEVFCSSCDQPIENGKEFCDVHLTGALRFSFSLALDEAAGIAKRSEKYGFVVVKVCGSEALSVLNGLVPTESIRAGGQDLDFLTGRMTPYLNKLLTCRLGAEEAFREDAGMEFEFGLVRKGDGQDAIYSFVDTKFV